MDSDPVEDPIHHRNQAFAAALAGLFGRYPVPLESIALSHRAGAIELARYGRLTLLRSENLEVLCVPVDEIQTVMALVYGDLGGML